mmetsp:Transcript_6212/g.9075  ORF Transcript_6212/g.9075 Transcript_6212/m.9075 type:complete len:214 (+) Transcript_6212:433-1074(+)|eukprot:CAMPEP_0172429444 /NCGR_PEP_ID=MMETSP1064-20121228/50360_1 /TAXON_ID=202472 /ORGANISM="Aulacoseira subarctica , Strain CCAP 1002/5" /LENGTH=213 /DNA_ID=CAMNT_0013174837 /DNA_START=402 /DNA_END=1043 /DNA_ORIENTATION=+
MNFVGYGTLDGSILVSHVAFAAAIVSSKRTLWNDRVGLGGRVNVRCVDGCVVTDRWGWVYDVTFFDGKPHRALVYYDFIGNASGVTPWQWCVLADIYSISQSKKDGFVYPGPCRAHVEEVLHQLFEVAQRCRWWCVPEGLRLSYVVHFASLLSDGEEDVDSPRIMCLEEAVIGMAVPLEGMVYTPEHVVVALETLFNKVVSSNVQIQYVLVRT